MSYPHLHYIAEQEKQIAALRAELDAASQRPTQWAYEAACKAIEKHRARAEAYRQWALTLNTERSRLRVALEEILVAADDVACYEIAKAALKVGLTTEDPPDAAQAYTQ